MHNSGFVFDRAYTSVLKRAIRTLWIVLDEMDLMWIPAIASWRLNERFYGDLQGRKERKWKKSTAKSKSIAGEEDFGSILLHCQMMTSAIPGNDLRYRDLEMSQIPKTESLEDMQNRLLPFWQDQIASELQQGKNILVVSHGNTIRSQVKYLEGISDQDIEQVEMPTGSSPGL